MQDGKSSAAGAAPFEKGQASPAAAITYKIERLTKDGWHCFASCSDPNIAHANYQAFRKDMPRVALRIVEDDGTMRGLDGRRIICLHDPIVAEDE